MQANGLPLEIRAGASVKVPRGQLAKISEREIRENFLREVLQLPD